MNRSPSRGPPSTATAPATVHVPDTALTTGLYQNRLQCLFFATCSRKLARDGPLDPMCCCALLAVPSPHHSSAYAEGADPTRKPLACRPTAAGSPYVAAFAGLAGLPLAICGAARWACGSPGAVPRPGLRKRLAAPVRRGAEFLGRSLPCITALLKPYLWRGGAMGCEEGVVLGLEIAAHRGRDGVSFPGPERNTYRTVSPRLHLAKSRKRNLRSVENSPQAEI